MKVMTFIAAAALAAGVCVPAQAGSCGSCASEKKGCSAAEKAAKASVTTDELSSLVEAKSAVVLDARSGKWDDGRRIPGAKALSAEATADQVASAVPAKDALVVTYCSSTKCGASKALASHLRKLGYTNVKEYHEGIDGWTGAGKAVESKGS